MNNHLREIVNTIYNVVVNKNIHFEEVERIYSTRYYIVADVLKYLDSNIYGTYITLLSSITKYLMMSYVNAVRNDVFTEGEVRRKFQQILNMFEKYLEEEWNVYVVYEILSTLIACAMYLHDVNLLEEVKMEITKIIYGKCYEKLDDVCKELNMIKQLFEINTINITF